MKSTEIPQSLQGIFWSTQVKNLDPDRDKNYIVHQTLAYGTLEQLRWLFHTYGRETVRNVFLNEPQNIYTPPALALIKIILRLEDVAVDKQRYVNTAPRRIDR